MITLATTASGAKGWNEVEDLAHFIYRSAPIIGRDRASQPVETAPMPSGMRARPLKGRKTGPRWE